MSEKIAIFKDLDDLANLTAGTSAGFITDATDNMCVSKGNFDTVSKKTIEANGNGLMFVEGSESSGYSSERLILLKDVQYISEITATLLDAPNIPAEGGSSYATWKLTQYYKASGATKVTKVEWEVTGSVVEKGSKGTTISNVTDAGNSTKTETKNGKSITLSQVIKQNGNYVTELTISGHSLSYAAIGAGATSASATHSAGTLTYKFTSGRTTTTKPDTAYGTLSDTHTYSLAKSQNGFTAVDSNGKLTATSYGTTIGNARTSGTVTCTRTCTWTPTTSYNAAGTKTKTNAATATCTQAGNYVTKVEAKPYSGVAHVIYSNISAGGTTSSPQGNGTATYTFTSGSTTTDGSGTPSFGGSASYSRTYAEKANSDASNVFTVNTTNGTVTTSHRGTTPGDARSVTVTATLVVKYTHANGMSAPNTSVSGTPLVNDVVVTQDENKITSYGNWTTPTVTVNPISFAAAGGTATITISGDCTRENTWSSGSKSTDTALISSASATLGTVENNYTKLKIGVNTTGSIITGKKVTINWSFDGSVVISVESNSYSQVGQSDCTLTLTGSTKVYHETATIIGKASVAGIIYWGTSQTSMTQSTSVSANVDTIITNRTSLGTTTIYAYFVPTDKNYKTLGSSSAYHTSASAKITQASDASITITTSNKTYDGSAQTVVTCDSTHGVSTWALGYATSDSATANSGVTWIEDKTNLSLTNAGTYYIWRRWTADGNHSNTNSGTKIDATVTISKKAATVTAGSTSKTYDGSALTYKNATLSGQVSGHTLGSYTCTGSITNVGSANNVPSAAKILSGSTDVTANYNITYKNGTLTVSNASFTVSALNQTYTYTGSAQGAAITVSGLKGSQTATIKYGTTSGTYDTTTAPKITNANEDKTIYWQVTAPNHATQTGSYTITMNKATPTMTLTGTSKTYDGNTYYVSAKASVAGIVYYGTTSATSGMTSNKSVSANTSANLTGRKDAGTTTVYAYFVPTDGTNYNSLGSSSNDHTSASVVISKATGYLTATTTNRTYTGSAQTIGTISTNSGTYYFGLGSSTTSAPTSWGSANTALTATTAGTYYVWAKCDASTNYNAVSAKYIGTVTIGKATPTMTLAGSNKTYNGSTSYITATASVAGKVYYGTTSATSGMSTAVSVSANTATNLTSITNAGTLTVYAYFVPTDTANYNSLGSSSNDHASKSITISKATPTMTLAGSNKTYDGKAAYITGTASVAGKIYYGTTSATSGMSTAVSVSANTATNLTSITNAGTLTVYAYFVPTDGTNYNSLGSSSNDHASKSITISKATGYLTATTTNRTYTGSAQTIGTISTNSGTYYFGLGSSTTSAPTSWGSANTALTATTAGTYYVWAKCDASTNYNAVSAKYIGTVTIGKATGSISVSRKTLTYTGSAHTIATSTATGTYYLGLGSSSTSAPSSWGSANTALTATTAGTYYVWAKCDAGDNHNAVSAYYVGTAVINKKATTAPTLTAGSKTTYDGSAVYAQAASASSNPAGKIYYGASSGATTYNITASTTAANLTSMGQTNVGTTTIYAFFRPTDTNNYSDSSVVSTTAKVTNKATGYLTATTTNRTYSGSAQTIATISTNSGSYYFGLGSSSTSAPTTWSSANVAQSATAAGTYYVWVKCDASTNYNAVAAKYIGEVTIGKRTVTITAPTKTDRTYSGSAQTIFTAGSCTAGGTMYYSDTNKTFSTSTWSTTIPTPKQTNAGTYIMYYYCYVSDVANNTGSGINTVKYVSAVIGNAAGSGTITMSGWTYGGTVTNPTVTKNPNNASVSYTWYNSSKTRLSSKPGSTSTAGTYYVKATFGAVTNYNAYTTDYVSFTIAKANGSGTLSMSGWTYGSTAKSPSVSTSSDGYITYTYYNSAGTSLGATRPSDAGTYKVKATVAEGTNYKSFTTNEVSFTIAQRAVTVTPPTATDRTYNGTAQTIFSGGSCTTGGTMYYSDTNKTFSTSTWSKTIPTPNQTTAGTYTMYYYCYVSDTINNKAASGSTINSAVSVSATINRKNGSCTVSMEGWTYGETAKSPSASSTTNSGAPVTYTYYKSDQTTSLGATKPTTAGTYYVTATFADTTNYNACTSSKYKFVISKATPTMSLAGSNKTYNGSASYITGTASVAGKIYYGTTSSTSGMSTAVSVSANTATNLTSITNAGTLTVYAYFVPTDGTNYNSLGSSSNDHASKSITISKATGSGDISMTGWTYGDTAKNPTVTSNPNNVSVTYEWYDEDVGVGMGSKPVSTSPAGNYSVRAVFAATTNYNSYTTSYKKFTISKRNVTYKANDQRKTYDGSALNASAKATLTSGSLVNGHTATFSCTGSITNYGTLGWASKVLSSVTIKSGSTDVTSNYNITKTNGYLYIDKRPVTFTATTQGKNYDGSALYVSDTAELTSGTLANGHRATSFGCNGTARTDVGRNTKYLNDVTIKSGSVDVTSNYNITRKSGYIQIYGARLTFYNRGCGAYCSYRLDKYSGGKWTNNLVHCNSSTPRNTTYGPFNFAPSDKIYVWPGNDGINGESTMIVASHGITQDVYGGTMYFTDLNLDGANPVVGTNGHIEYTVPEYMVEGDDASHIYFSPTSGGFIMTGSIGIGHNENGSSTNPPVNPPYNPPTYDSDAY